MTLAPNDRLSYFQRGWVEILSGDFERGAANQCRAFELNPNDAIILFLLSWTEAAAGNVGRAKELADQALRISPKDRCIGTAHLAHAMSAFIEQDFTGRRHRGELAVQSHPTAPIRRVPMIVYAAEVGDTELLHTHREALQRVAPDFYRVCSEASFVPFASPSI